MKLRTTICSLGLLALLFLAYQRVSYAQSLEDFEENVTEFTLDNGLTFIVVERPVAPVVSMVTFADVGGVDEPYGHTGMAHIFEHMAFKGTPEIGTTNWEKEKPLLNEIDDLYQQWLNQKYSPEPDTTKMNEVWKQFMSKRSEAEEYVKNNEFSEIIERNGGVGLNAGTGADLTIFFYSLPENRIKLWFSLESQRFKNPVFREFYKEKEVVREERRRRTESNPVGGLIEEFAAVAYTGHPYQNPVIGWNSDITATTVDDAKAFYNKYYVPENLTMAIAGDVEPDNIKELAETYFGDMQAAPEPPPVYTKEPEQRGERRFTIQGQSQPVFLMAHHTVAQDHPDAPALQLLARVLSGGRTSILYKRMVQEEQTALQVVANNGFTGIGTKYETMFMTLGVPNQGVSVDTIETTILEEINKIKQGNIPKEALERARTNARANLIRSLDSNSGLAQALAVAEGQKGDWRKVFTDLKKLEDVTVDDLQRVAQKYLTKDNRTVGILTNKQNAGEVADANQ